MAEPGIARLACGKRRSQRAPVRPKRNRAVATRYDKLAVRYEATLTVAAINEWL
jgi:hypothetical protein